jgi:hypothetical protein
MPELGGSNRVKLQGDRAFVPLEADPGGFAIIDVSNPALPRLVHLETNIPGISTPYTLEVNRDYLYIFSGREPKMAVFRLDRGAAPVGPGASGGTFERSFGMEGDALPGAPPSGSSRMEVEGARGG